MVEQGNRVFARITIPTLMPAKHLPNFLREVNTFSLALAGRTLALGVKATFRDAQFSAHHDNKKLLLVLFDKLIFHLVSREKMLRTFFSTSLSCRKISFSRFKRRFSSSSAV